MIYKFLTKVVFVTTFLFSSQIFAVTTSDIENANPEGQTVEFWVQYSDERLDFMKARAERFEAETGIKVNITYKGHYGKVQSAMMTSAGTPDQADVARGYGNAAADMYQIGAAMDQSILANSKKWGVTQDDIDDWGANWTVGFSGYFDGNPKLLHEVGKSIEVVYYNKDWLNELGLSEPKTPAEFADAACAATNSSFSSSVGDAASLGYEIDTDASNFAAWVFAHGGDVFDYDAGQYILNGPAAVLRRVESKIPEMGQFDLPDALYDIIDMHKGLVLVTGPTGSGKSTTLAAIVNEINKTRTANIITVEDPVEFIHTDSKSIVSHREVGKQTQTFASALKAALREDPDVILVGEMRDLETVSLALTAAETGHLVFGTLHTSGAPNTINRIIDVFPPEQQAQIRAQLSTSLKMVVTQRLLKTKDGQGRVGAFEIMKCTAPIQNLIREAKIHQIPSIMQTAVKDGMITMSKSLENLVNAGKIDANAGKES